MSRTQPNSARDITELIFGYGLILFVLWMPDFPQRILSPVALLATLAIILARLPTLDELGVGTHDLLRSLWILPAALAIAALSIWIAKHLGTLHPLYKGDFKHITGYILWTTYQQFLLQN